MPDPARLAEALLAQQSMLVLLLLSLPESVKGISVGAAAFAHAG
jgi:hypothetical protein